jgi:phage gp16-like protein
MSSTANLTQLLNIGKSQLGIEDDVWREQILPRFGGQADASGRISLKSLSAEQQNALLMELKEKGFKVTVKDGKGKRARTRTPRERKIWAMWLAMADKGIVRQRSERALCRWIKQHQKIEVDSLSWLNGEQLNAVIESLKQWQERAE